MSIQTRDAEGRVILACTAEDIDIDYAAVGDDWERFEDDYGNFVYDDWCGWCLLGRAHTPSEHVSEPTASMVLQEIARREGGWQVAP